MKEYTDLSSRDVGSVALRGLDCQPSIHVTAVMAFAVARSSGIPLNSFSRTNGTVSWRAFKCAANRDAHLLSNLPLTRLSYGERFALAIGVLFDSDQLPRGSTLLEILTDATGVDAGQAGNYSLRALLSMDSVQSALPRQMLESRGIEIVSEATQHQEPSLPANA